MRAALPRVGASALPLVQYSSLLNELYCCIKELFLHLRRSIVEAVPPNSGTVTRLQSVHALTAHRSLPLGSGSVRKGNTS